jgi:type II secretory pathway pseudopilin PulG
LTLVELLVVIAIVGVLVALIIPAVQMARESSRRTACRNNLRQIGLGIIKFEATHLKYPPGKMWSGPPADPKSFARAWPTFILEYIEQNAPHDRLDFKRDITDSVALPVTTQIVKVNLCPTTGRVEEHRTLQGQLARLGGIPGEGLGCIDYMGVSGPDKDSKHPTTKQLYGRQRGVLTGTKGLPYSRRTDRAPADPGGSGQGWLVEHNLRRRVHGAWRGLAAQDGKLDALHGAWASGSNVSHIDGSINKIPKVWYSEQIHFDHRRGAQILICDGSVHFATTQISKSLPRHSRRPRTD